MENATDGLDTLPVDLASTRPTMLRIPYLSQWLGEVPIGIGAILVTAVMIGYVHWSWRGMVWFPFVWFILAKAIEYDFHALTKLQLWQRYVMPTLDSHKWGGASDTPLPTTSKIPQGME